MTFWYFFLKKKKNYQKLFFLVLFSIKNNKKFLNFIFNQRELVKNKI